MGGLTRDTDRRTHSGPGDSRSVRGGGGHAHIRLSGAERLPGCSQPQRGIQTCGIIHAAVPPEALSKHGRRPLTERVCAGFSGHETHYVGLACARCRTMGGSNKPGRVRVYRPPCYRHGGPEHPSADEGCRPTRCALRLPTDHLPQRLEAARIAQRWGRGIRQEAAGGASRSGRIIEWSE